MGAWLVENPRQRNRCPHPRQRRRCKNCVIHRLPYPVRKQDAGAGPDAPPPFSTHQGQAMRRTSQSLVTLIAVSLRWRRQPKAPASSPVKTSRTRRCCLATKRRRPSKVIFRTGCGGGSAELTGNVTPLGAGVDAAFVRGVEFGRIGFCCSIHRLSGCPPAWQPHAIEQTDRQTDRQRSHQPHRQRPALQHGDARAVSAGQTRPTVLLPHPFAF